jgi:uncharacterized protein DUF4328
VSYNPARDTSFYWLRKTSKWLIAFLIASIILSIVQTSIGYALYDSLDIALHDPVDEKDILLIAFGSLVLVNYAILIIWAVIFLFWFYKAYKNFGALGIRSWKYSPRSAVVFFFVPIANLWIPYIIAKEIWNYSDTGSLLSEEPWNYKSKRSEIVTLWWITGVISVGLSILASFGFVIIEGLVETLNIASLIFLIIMVKEVTRRQEAKYNMIKR